MTRPAATDALRIACLCAAWCGTCRDYEAVLEAQRAALPDALYTWVDIEDHEDVVDDIEIEDFPTVLIARGDTVLFFGTITPQPGTLARLVQAAEAGGLAAVGDAAVVELARRVQALPTL
jgi:hypothetical protein